MTTTQQQELEQLFAINSLEFQPPCDGIPGYVDCDRAAQWRALLDCGHTRLWCDFHKQRIEEIVNWDVPNIPRGYFNCVQHTPWGLAKILILEPMNSG